MIQRINLLQKKEFEITYGMLFAAFGAMLLICLALFGVQFLLHQHTTRQLGQLTADIEKLKKERERLLKKEDIVKGTGPYIEIVKTLYKIPPWPALLNNLSLILPPDVWLENIKSSDKKGATAKKEISIKGEAKKAQSLTRFMKELEKAPYFDNVLLDSKEEKGFFKFDITCDISEGPWR